MFYDDVLSFDPPHAHLFKPGFHMMATIVTITVISEKVSSAIAVIICKPLSNNCSICSNHSDNDL